MAEEVDGTISKILDQSVAENARILGHAGIRMNNAASFVQEQAQLGLLNESRLVGAAAAQRLEKDALASEILQQRSARDQPNVKPGG